MKGFLFWIVSLTWGIIMTAIGLIAALGLIITGHKPKRFHYLIYFEVGKHWGGVNFGAIFITDDTPSMHTKQHESGHGLQNIMLGIFMPFIVGIPSAIRYWYREYIYRKDKKRYSELPEYDAFWVENWATKLGKKYFSEI